MLAIGGNFAEVLNAADIYGIFEDLYGEDKFFNPVVNLDIQFDSSEDFLTPVYRGIFFF